MNTDNNGNTIQGVILTPLRIISDDRGSVMHMIRSDSKDFVRFGECYFSEILPGVIKAWKRHTLQTQNFTVPVGKIQLVIYDNREKSVTKNRLMDFTVGRPENYFRVTIPPGLWYGFKCIGVMPALLVNCADFPHDKLEGETLDINHSLIPYSWIK